MKLNKTFKIVAIVMVIFILVSSISFAIYFYLELNYDEQITERLTEDVVVINDLFGSMYLVKSDSGYIAIDTGFFNSFIEKGLKYNNISKADIKYIFLTHSDADHVNGIKLFKKAKIFFPAEERKMLDHKKQRFTFLPFYSNGFNIQQYILVSDNEEIELLGKKIYCISLPGHTDGTMGYIIGDKYLFSGDAFRIKNGKLDVPFKKQFVMDLKRIQHSLKKVASLDSVKYIFSSHSGFTTDYNFAVSDIK